jgi:hypothetical protein
MTVAKARISGIVFLLLAAAGTYYLTTVIDISMVLWIPIGLVALFGAFMVAVLLTPVDRKEL